jgi:hypothetical protein
MKKITWVIVVVIIAITSVFFIISGWKGKYDYDSFAKCLTEKGFVMYGTDWCRSCQLQKALFGASFKHINYKNCDINKDVCIEKNIKRYPTWIIDGKYYIGKHSLEVLGKIAGCSLEEKTTEITGSVVQAGSASASNTGAPNIRKAKPTPTSCTLEQNCGSPTCSVATGRGGGCGCGR